jgi:hypothetical protein
MCGSRLLAEMEGSKPRRRRSGRWSVMPVKDYRSDIMVGLSSGRSGDRDGGEAGDTDGVLMASWTFWVSSASLNGFFR